MKRDAKLTFILCLFLSVAIHLFALISFKEALEQKLASTKSESSISISIKNTSIPIPVPRMENAKSRTPKPNESPKVVQSSNSGQGVQKPQLLGDFKPVYPHLSRIYEEEGTVSVKIRINDSGIVISALIIKSSGYQRLDNQALESLMKTNFIPAKDTHNKPIISELVQDITFKLGR